MNQSNHNSVELPNHIKNETGQAILGYSTPILGLKTDLLTEKPILLGSATLVQFGKERGLLTAQHVIESSDFKSCMQIGLIITRKIGRFKIRREYLLVNATKSCSTEFGPDLAFIKIPEIDAGKIAARTAFWQMDGNRSKITKILAGRNNGFWTIFGCPSEFIRIEPGKSGFDHTFVPGGLLGTSGKPKFFSKSTYDYYDVPVIYENDNDLPMSFKGVSGGGLWYVPLFKNTNGPETIRVGYPSLMGVAFYQTDNANNCRTIRCHGPKSIYVKMQNILDVS